MSFDENIFKTHPLNIVDGIPIFSKVDNYIENYQKISSDHLASFEKGIDNPFIESDLWMELESSTRILVQKYASPGARILDVGIGLGRLLGPLESYDRHGIDISLDYLKHAKATGCNVAYSRIEDMPYHDNFFDVVVATDVLEHVFDLNFCCKQILRVLKPGGILIVRVPNKEDLDVYLSEGLPYEFIHMRSFDLSELKLLFGKILGCTYIDHSFVSPYLQGAPRLRLRLLPKENYARILAQNLSKEEVHKNDNFFSEHPLSFLQKVTMHTEEDVINWIYNLQNQFPEIFNQIADSLIYHIEVNVVFKK